MIGRLDIPASYRHWNRLHGAPFGFRWSNHIPRRYWTWPVLANLVGGYAYQPNSTARTLEYPWAFEALNVFPGAKVLEIGGGLSGFQFSLSRSGCEVVNIDPGNSARGVGWPVDPQSIGLLNRRFGTSVILKNCFIEEAGLENSSFDRVVSISVIEHIPRNDILTILGHIRRVLKPGGLVVLTVDLFLDLQPFTAVETNKFGRNVSVRWMVENSGLNLVAGRPEELYGFQAFDAVRILEHLPEYLIGSWPALVQMLVLQK